MNLTSVRSKIALCIFAFCSLSGILPPVKATIIKKLLWLVFYSLPLIAFAANLTEPRSDIVRPQSSQNFPMPVKVIIYKSRRAHFADVSRVLEESVKRRGGIPAAQAVKTY